MFTGKQGEFVIYRRQEAQPEGPPEQTSKKDEVDDKEKPKP